MPVTNSGRKPFAKPTQFKYWSYSGWSTWAQCAFKAKCKQIDKLKEPQSPPLERGDKIHKEAAGYMRKLLVRPPTCLGMFKNQLAQIRKRDGVQVEQSWAFTKDWVRCSGSDWDNAWLRVKIDLHYLTQEYELVIIDYKTGQDKSESDDNADQLHLYATTGMIIYPDAKKVTTRLLYLDHGTEATKTVEVTPGLAAAYRKHWAKQVLPMMADNIFSKSPSRLCGWCHFRKSNGGPCDQG